MIDEFLRSPTGVERKLLRSSRLQHGDRARPGSMAWCAQLRAAGGPRADHLRYRRHAVAQLHHVGDVVRAMVALIDEPRAIGQVFNIGNGTRSPSGISRSDQGADWQHLVDRDHSYDQAHEAGFGHAAPGPRHRQDPRLVGYEPTVELDGS